MEAIRQQLVGELSTSGPQGRSVGDDSEMCTRDGRDEGESHSTTSPLFSSSSSSWSRMRLPTYCAFMSLCFVLLFGIAASIAEGQSVDDDDDDAVALAAVRSGVISTDVESSVAMTENLDGRWHDIAAGENLKQVSARYYGSSSHWRILQVSNDVGRYPAQGTRLWIPATADGWFAEEQTAVILLSDDAQENQDDDRITASIITRP